MGVFSKIIMFIWSGNFFWMSFFIIGIMIYLYIGKRIFINIVGIIVIIGDFGSIFWIIFFVINIWIYEEIIIFNKIKGIVLKMIFKNIVFIFNYFCGIFLCKFVRFVKFIKNNKKRNIVIRVMFINFFEILLKIKFFVFILFICKYVFV